ELDTNCAASEHDEAGRNAASPDRLATRPVVDVVQTLERWNRRNGSGRDDELVVLDLTVADRDGTRSDHPCVAAHELGALILDPAGVPRVVASVRHLIATAAHTLDGDLPGQRLGGAGRDLRGSHDLRRP